MPTQQQTEAEAIVEESRRKNAAECDHDWNCVGEAANPFPPFEWEEVFKCSKCGEVRYE